MSHLRDTNLNCGCLTVMLFLLSILFLSIWKTDAWNGGYLIEQIEATRNTFDVPSKAVLLFGGIGSNMLSLGVYLSERHAFMQLHEESGKVKYSSYLNTTFDYDDGLTLSPTYLQHTETYSFSKAFTNNDYYFNEGFFICPRFFRSRSPLILNYVADYNMHKLVKNFVIEGKETKLKFLLVINSRFLDPEGNHAHFIDMISRISEIFPNLDLLKRSLKLIVTHVKYLEDEKIVKTRVLLFLENITNFLRSKSVSDPLITLNLQRLQSITEIFSTKSKIGYYYDTTDINYWSSIPSNVAYNDIYISSVTISKNDISFIHNHISQNDEEQKKQVERAMRDFRKSLIGKISLRIEREKQAQVLEIKKHKGSKEMAKNLLNFFKQQIENLNGLISRLSASKIIDVTSELVSNNKQRFELENYFGFISFMSLHSINVDPISSDEFLTKLRLILEDSKRYALTYESVLINLPSVFSTPNALHILSGNYLFPFAIEYKDYLVKNPSTSLLDVKTQQLRNRLYHEEVTGERDKRWFSYQFCEGSNAPFYKWGSDEGDNHKLIGSLLRGKKVELESKIQSSYGFPVISVVKYWRIYFRWSVQGDEVLSKELDEVLSDSFKYTLVHSGFHHFYVAEKENDYKKFRSQFFVLKSPIIDYDFSHTGKVRPAGHNYRFGDEKNFLSTTLSPYTKWIMKLDIDDEATSDNYEILEKFIDLKVDLELCGHGLYLEPSNRPDNLDDVMKYYGSGIL